jgi:hypothetical protein
MGGTGCCLLLFVVLQHRRHYYTSVVFFGSVVVTYIIITLSYCVSSNSRAFFLTCCESLDSYNNLILRTEVYEDPKNRNFDMVVRRTTMSQQQQ